MNCFHPKLSRAAKLIKSSTGGWEMRWSLANASGRENRGARRDCHIRSANHLRQAAAQFVLPRASVNSFPHHGLNLDTR